MKKIIVCLAIFLMTIVVLPSVSSAATIEELQAQINSLLAQISRLQSQLAGQPSSSGGSSGSGGFCHTFNTDLKIGDQGSEVSALLTALTMNGVATERSSNFASIFDETMASYVSAFQQKYKSEVLTPAGLYSPTGYVGGRTRTKLNSLYGCTNLPPDFGHCPERAAPSLCPNGLQPSQVPGTCDFSCNTAKVCTTDAKLCPDGRTYVSRIQPNCEFATCPSTTATPSVTVLSPNGGVWETGKSYPITWSASNAPSDAWVGIVRLYKGIMFQNDIVPSFSWNKPNATTYYSVPTNSATGNDFKIHVVLNKGPIGSESNVAEAWSPVFSIVAPTTQTPPSISIIGTSGSQSSNTSINATVGNTFTISGTPQNLSGLSYYYSSGNPPSGYFNRAYFFDQNFVNNNSCGNNDAPVNGVWTMTCTAKVPGSSTFYVEIYANGQTYRSNIVTVNIVAPQPSITVLSPNGGEIWNYGTTHSIRLGYLGKFPDGVNIYLDECTMYPCASSLIVGRFMAGSEGVSNSVMEYPWDTKTLQSGGGISQIVNNGRYKITVKDAGNRGYNDQSNAPFSIVTPTPSNGTLTFSQPSFYATYTQGTPLPNTNSLIKYLELTNTSGVKVGYTISVPNRPSWLSYQTNQLLISPGQVGSISVYLDPTTVANSPGIYTTNIILTGNFVGSPRSIPVTLTVVAAPVVTVPTSVTLTATPNSDGSYLLSWTSTNATSCVSSGDGASWGWPSDRYISGGQYTPVITSPQTFTITCTGSSGSVTKSVKVSVVAPVSANNTYSNSSQMANALSSITAALENLLRSLR